MPVKRLRKKKKKKSKSILNGCSWRLPMPEPDTCCECGGRLDRVVDPGRSDKKPRIDGDTVFCGYCVTARFDAACAELQKIMKAYRSKRPDAFPHWDNVERAVRWIEFWSASRSPGEQPIPGISQKTYKLPAPDPKRFPNWKQPKHLPGEKRAGDSVKAKVKALVKAAGYETVLPRGAQCPKVVNNVLVLAGRKHEKERKAAQKAVAKFCTLIGAEFRRYVRKVPKPVSKHGEPRPPLLREGTR